MIDITRLVKEEVLAQEAYPIDTRSCRIKLDANENPFSLPLVVKERMGKLAEGLALNRYPEPGSPALIKAFSEHLGVEREMLLIGNGSDELIQVLLTALAPRLSGGVMIPIPTFAMYKISALNNSHQVIEIPLDEQFRLKTDEMLQVISARQPEIIFLAYPNNPPGNCFETDAVEAIIGASEGLVVVDEAYVSFSGHTFLPSLQKYENLVILRTLSKIGFAALRVGILIGHPQLVHQLNKVRLPYNLNLFSQLVALLFLEFEEEFIKHTQRLVSQREILFQGLEALDGIHPFPSDANFILFSCFEGKYDVYERLVNRGVMIKNFPSAGPLRDCMRVTVGTEEENRYFLEALRDAVHP